MQVKQQVQQQAKPSKDRIKNTSQKEKQGKTKEK